MANTYLGRGIVTRHLHKDCMTEFNQQIKEEYYAGKRHIDQAFLDGRLSSKESIDAYAMWRTVSFIKTRLEEEPLCLEEIGAHDVIRWMK